MSKTDIDILILRGSTHGLSAEEYADELRERLPEKEIRLAHTPAEERNFVRSASIVTSTNVDEELLSHAQNLKLFAGVAAGYNHLPLETMADMGVAVTNASGIHAPNIAEQVIGKILLFTRNLHIGLRRSQRHEWRHFQANELKGSTVTIVGLGAIGSAIANRLDGFKVETTGVRYTPEKGGPTDEVIGFDENAIHGALAQTDYLVLASPLTDETRGLISTTEFKTLPPDAVVVNIGRGPIVDTTALVEAIQSNHIRGAALDVTDPEPLPPDHVLWRFENVLITPHNAGHSPKHYERLADILARNVERVDKMNSYTHLENQILDPE